MLKIIFLGSSACGLVCWSRNSAAKPAPGSNSTNSPGLPVPLYENFVWGLGSSSVGLERCSAVRNAYTGWWFACLSVDGVTDLIARALYWSYGKPWIRRMLLNSLSALVHVTLCLSNSVAAAYLTPGSNGLQPLVCLPLFKLLSILW